ncbi:MAG: PLP-dependent transferase [Steroidobacteraceae bacterium]|jgi:cystathionine beta-lyase/cystathionine gamma-synthase|nr:PLP-dependent transferase [Steroidobacteraceae bacterium]
MAPASHTPRHASIGGRGPATDHRRAADGARNSDDDRDLAARHELSPLRHTTTATGAADLAREQLRHFSIDAGSDAGRALLALVEKLYTAHEAAHELWRCMLEGLDGLDRRDRIAWFNAKRFACFQLAKILDTLQNPLRRTWQTLDGGGVDAAVRGPYPLFDNVSAIFSATPVITRTATYLYACTEWVEDAFRGKELLHQVYSRLLNPTSISLANQIVEVEAGTLAPEYFAWNFNSGMAAIDAVLANVLGRGDVVLASRNVYGGTWQLLHDWYGRRANLDVAVESFDGFSAADFQAALGRTRLRHADRLEGGRQVYVFLESPCNPHGYVLDVPGICAAAHAAGLTVICDATVGTPFLQPVLQRADPAERPDFVVHSYTKDLAGSGTTTAGVAIARTERMFIPKGESVTAPGPDGRPCEWRWDRTLFWNVYYVKGAFLDADKAFDVIDGMRTLEMRMLQKCIHTVVLARVLASHPRIRVHCSAVRGDPNHELASRLLHLGLPAPLFTIDFEPARGETAWLPPAAFKRFFDNLEPAFGLQVSLGQTNTVVLGPGVTSHSELPPEALREAGIAPTTIRIAVGDEDPRRLLAQFMHAAALALEPVDPGFCARFPSARAIDRFHERTWMRFQRRRIRSRRPMADWLGPGWPAGPSAAPGSEEQGVVHRGSPHDVN